MTGLFETLVFGILLVAFFLNFLPKKRFGRAAFYAAGLAFAGFVAVSTFGTPRGPLIPGALLALILPFVTFFRLEYPKPNNWRRGTVFGVYIVLTSVLAAVAIILPLGFPVFDPPAPSGPYGVGYARAVITDDSRTDVVTGTARELPVQVWYPASIPAGAEPLPFIPDAEQGAHLMADNLGLPLEFFDYLADMKGHSFEGAPVAAVRERFPVLVYSHGFGSIGAQNALLMEHLASHGYVIFSLEHPHQNAWVRLAADRTASFNPQGFRFQELTAEKTAELEATLVRMVDAPDYESHLREVTTFMNEQAGFITGLRLWLDDTAYLLDQVQAGEISAFDPLYAHMDTAGFGIFGMSYGGAAAGMMCLEDARCTAGINMDGLQFGEHNMSFPISRPFMLMNSDGNLFLEPEQRQGPTRFRVNEFVYRQAAGPMYSVTVANAKHMNYSDFAYLMPVAQYLGMFGPVDAADMNTVMNNFVRGFFDRYMMGRPAPVLDRMAVDDPVILEFTHRNLGEGTLAQTGQMNEGE
jgi:predicted dienelactone hydrolase